MNDTSVKTGIPGNDLPEKRVSLSEVSLGVGSGNKIRINAFLSNNLGHRTLTTCLPLHKFHDMSMIANDRTNMPASEIAQRPLDLGHAKKLGFYILKGLVASAITIAKEKNEPIPQRWYDVQKELGTQAYQGLQPIVVNIRSCKFGGIDLMGTRQGGCWEIELEQAHKLWVVDGQHRRKGMEMLFEFLANVRQRAAYGKRDLFFPTWAENHNALTYEEMALWEVCDSIAQQNANLAVEIHLGLSPEQERQLFHDMNRLVKKMDTNLALDFDTSNPVNTFTKEFLIENIRLPICDVETKDWDNDDGGIARKDVTSVNARLFMNKTNINGATNDILQTGEVTAKLFWLAVAKIPSFGQKNAHKNTVAAQPVVLKALAKLAYDFKLSRRKPENGDELFERLLAAIDQTGERKIDFNHDNPLWRYYELSQQERDAYGLTTLAAYLPDESTGNRDIGQFQNPYFRFGSKHNDIFPIIGDMIRWQLGFPSRK